MPVHAPAGAGKNAKPHGFARGNQVGIELYRMYTYCMYEQTFVQYVVVL